MQVEMHCGENETQGCVRQSKGCEHMKIEEARQIYSTQIRSYREQQVALVKQKQELEQKMQTTPDGKTIYANEAAILELTIQAVDEKQQEYQDYMAKILEQQSAISNMVSSRQQGEAMEEYVDDLGKIMEVARRLMHGDIVPPQDEKKLLEYSMELYQSAKNIGAMVKEKERKEHDSLWEDEEEPQEYEDPMETANNTEVFAAGPEIVDVADTMASVSLPE